MSQPAPASEDQSFLKKFLCLRTVPREFWIILAAYVLENVAYKLSTGPVLPLWLAQEIGMSDNSKGLTIAIWSALLTLFTVLVGSFTDTVGIRRTFLLGFLICTVARVFMLFGEPHIVPLGMGLLPLALGLALMTPVMTAAMKRYSNAAQRSMAFSLYYALMNLGFAIGDRMFDYFRKQMGEYGSWIMPVFDADLSTYQVMILWSVILTIPGLLLTWFCLREGVEMTEQGVRVTPLAVVTRGEGNLMQRFTRKSREVIAGIGLAIRQTTGRRWLFPLALVSVAIALTTWFAGNNTLSAELAPKISGSILIRIGWIVAGVAGGICLLVIGRDLFANTSKAGAETVRLFESLWPQKAFHRFLLFMALVVGVRMIFYHLNYTLPDYAIRELGKGAPFAQICNMLNSLMILALVPFCGALTQKISAYRMVSVGSLLSALSVFILALPPEWFKPMADGWLGHLIVHQWLEVAGPVNPLYLSIFWFTVLLSLGEALWSPRLYEYAAAIAPKGQEASYMALSVLPYFFAKFGAGSLSGWLLTTYCPAEGARNPAGMWLIIGMMALITPIGTYVFRKHIQVKEDGREV